MKGIGDLTIIIVTWNTWEMTRICLESIQKADPDHIWDTVVVDNASQDGTPEVIRSLFPWVTLVVNEENLGFGRANNLVLKQVTSEYVLLLNSDTTLSEEAVYALLDFMDAHPKAGVVGGQLIYPDGRLQNSIVPFPTLVTEFTNKSLLQILFPRKYPGKRHELTTSIEVDSVIGAAMMLRVEAVRSVGFFDEEYFFFLEETDLCFRLRKRGWKIYFVPEARIVHYQGSSVKKVRPQARVEYQRSLTLFFEKNYGERKAKILKYLGYLKAWINLMGALPSRIFRPSDASRWNKYKYLLSWYHRGCPADMGLFPK